MPVYYFSGHENYLKKKEINKIVSAVELPECNVADFYEFSTDIYDFINSAPFLGDKKVGILHFVPEQDSLISEMKELPDYIELYIVTNDFPDQRKKAVKELMQLVEKKEFNKIDESVLYASISARLKRRGYTTESIDSVKDILMDCFHVYTQSLDMDLDVVQKHIDMIAFTGELTEENIRAFAPESFDHRAYRLSNMLLAKDPECIDFAYKLLEQGENGISIFSLVSFQIRVCYKASLFSEDNYLNKIGIRSFQLYDRFRDYSAKQYKKVYELLMNGISRIKNGENASVVMADTLTDSLAVLKEDFNYD